MKGIKTYPELDLVLEVTRHASLVSLSNLVVLSAEAEWRTKHTGLLQLEAADLAERRSKVMDGVEHGVHVEAADVHADKSDTEHDLTIIG